MTMDDNRLFMPCLSISILFYINAAPGMSMSLEQDYSDSSGLQVLKLQSALFLDVLPGLSKDLKGLH